MAETTSALADAPVSGDILARAERFARESFVLPEEDAAAALAKGTARRAALDDAVAEIEAGRAEPSVEWRRNYSLMLGLERLLSEEEPHLADGALLSPHQVDALSGTLIALTSELEQALRNGNGRMAAGNGRFGEAALESDELYEDDFVQARLRRDDDEPLDEEEATDAEPDQERPDEEPLDWDPAEEAEEEAATDAQEEDLGASRRFWFEHATGAGKTVAALGFVEASRTGGVLILTHRRNLVDQFLGELRTRGYKKRISPPLLKNGVGEPPAGGMGRVLACAGANRLSGTVREDRNP